MRLTIFDGLRGHLLIGMLVIHLSFNDGLGFLRFFHHNQLIELYDAEFFVFIAGLLVGYLWDCKYRTDRGRIEFTLGRVRTIYLWYLISAIPFLLAHPIANPNLAIGAVEVMLMLKGGWFSDILPMYLICFALLLPVALSGALYRPAVVLPASFAIYVAAQMSNLLGFFGYTGAFVAFDVAAWQFVFFVSLMIGRRAMAWRDGILSAPRAIVLWSVPVLAAILIWLGQWPWFPDPMALRGGATDILPRMALHPLYVLRIGVAVLLFALLALRSDAWLAPIHRALHWYFSLRILRNIGRYSIQMFALHVYMTSLYAIFFADQPEDQRIAFAVIALISFVAAPNLWVALKGRPPLRGGSQPGPTVPRTPPV